MGGTAQLLTYFMEGLQTNRQWGPPRISYITMSDEEMCLVRQFNCQDGETREFAELESIEYLENEFTEEEVEVDYTCCSHCQEGGIANVQVAGDERIREFMRFQGIHESGLEVEYRCRKCSDCMDCKLSDKTEKISFKEESEMFKIKKSVTLDFENKKIQCSLPLRDKERTYLTNNRDRALKVLNQQLKKYNGDLKAKKIILEAFAKLFNNGMPNSSVISAKRNSTNSFRRKYSIIFPGGLYSLTLQPPQVDQSWMLPLGLDSGRIEVVENV